MDEFLIHVLKNFFLLKGFQLAKTRNLLHFVILVEWSIDQWEFFDQKPLPANAHAFLMRHTFLQWSQELHLRPLQKSIS